MNSTDTSTNMPKTTEKPQERRKNNVWKWLLGILGCCTLIVLSCSLCFYFSFKAQGISSFYETTTNYTAEAIQGSADDTIAVIDITGFISDFGGGIPLDGSSITSAEEIEKMIDYAVIDKEADAILFRINSPGGTLTGAETICQKIKEVKAKGIYTLAWIHTQGASGGYYIASCTDWIVSRQDSTTGSIGVVVEAMDVDAFLEKLGFKVRKIANTNSKYKTGEDIFVEGSEVDKQMKAILDENYEQFIGVIVEGRKGKAAKLTRSKILALSDGRIFSGKQAYQNGLIDEIGYQDDAVSSTISLAKLDSDATVIIIKQNKGFWGQLVTASLKKIMPPTIEVPTPGIVVLAIADI